MDKYKEARELLLKEIPDTSIPSIIRYLGESSRIGHPGRMGPVESCVNKEALRLASVYLQDYMYLLDNLKED